MAYWEHMGVAFCENVTSKKQVQEQRSRQKTFVVPIWLTRCGEGIQRRPFFSLLLLFWKEHGERGITQGRAAPPHWRVIVGRREIRQQDNRFRSDKGSAEQCGTDRWTMGLLAVLLELLCVPSRSTDTDGVCVNGVTRTSRSTDINRLLY